MHNVQPNDFTREVDRWPNSSCERDISHFCGVTLTSDHQEHFVKSVVQNFALDKMLLCVVELSGDKVHNRIFLQMMLQVECVEASAQSCISFTSEHFVRSTMAVFVPRAVTFTTKSELFQLHALNEYKLKC